jgi:NAD(P)-dependent dehydrogenase (short-subunit alcohol dehydrogenase family)
MFDTSMSDRMKAVGQTEALNAMVKEVPVGRLGRPAEIADAVLWPCTSPASMVVGRALVALGRPDRGDPARRRGRRRTGRETLARRRFRRRSSKLSIVPTSTFP